MKIDMFVSFLAGQISVHSTHSSELYSLIEEVRYGFRYVCGLILSAVWSDDNTIETPSRRPALLFTLQTTGRTIYIIHNIFLAVLKANYAHKMLGPLQRYPNRFDILTRISCNYNSRYRFILHIEAVMRIFSKIVGQEEMGLMD